MEPGLASMMCNVLELALLLVKTEVRDTRIYFFIVFLSFFTEELECYISTSIKIILFFIITELFHQSTFFTPLLGVIHKYTIAFCIQEQRGGR